METADLRVPTEILNHLREHIEHGLIGLPCVCTLVSRDRAVFTFELDANMRPTLLAARHSAWSFPILLALFDLEGRAVAFVLHDVPTPTAAQAEA